MQQHCEQPSLLHATSAFHCLRSLSQRSACVRACCRAWAARLIAQRVTGSLADQHRIRWRLSTTHWTTPARPHGRTDARTHA